MTPGLGALVTALRWLGVACLAVPSALLDPSSFDAPTEKRTTTERPKLARPTARALEARSTPTPTSLVEVLRGDAYGADCPILEDAYWPFEARRCTYFVGDRSYAVTTATPSAERVGAWITDASAMIPALAKLETADHAAWEKALGAIGRYTIQQSSRAFPLDGVVYEDFEGGTEYEFRGGVTFGVTNEKTRSCGECACRVNSLHRTEWCTYVADGLAANEKAIGYGECLASLGGERGWSDAWASTCLQLHADAWESGRSESYRALLHFVEKNQIAPVVGDGASPDDVVRAIEGAFTYPHRRAAAP